MADIPTYVARGDADTGSTGPRADASQFGGLAAEGAARLGQGLETGARQASIAINRMRADANIRQRFDDNRWAGQAYEQEKRTISEFMANPENNQKESFATDLDKFMKERMDQYTGDTAPSPKALSTFRDQMGSLSTSLYDHALGVSAQNAVNNGVNSVNTQIGDAVTTYRNTKQVDDKFATSMLKDSVAHISAGIDDNFGKSSPNIANKLHSDLITQSVLAASSSNPELARGILDWSDKIDEQTRRSLSHEIDQAANARNAVEVEAFNNTRQNLLVGAENGKVDKGLPLDIYEEFLPKDKAQVAKMRDDSYIGSMAKANKTISDLAPQEASYQLRALNELKNNLSTEDDRVAYQKVHQQVMENIKMQEHNPVGWLQKYNPVVSNLMSKVADAGPNDRLGAINNLNSAVLKYQGAPPPGRPEVKNADGSVSTVRSISVGDDKGEWVIPTVIGGKIVSNDEAIKQWRAGANNALGGPFKTSAEADKYAEDFHNQEAQRLEDKKQYLDRPIADQHLMGTDEATQNAADLNQANPKEFIQKMGEMLQRYPDNHHQMIAFNDMVTVPSGANALKQSYQLAWQNKDAWWLDTYIGALGAGKDIKLPEQDRKTIDQHIDSNPLWKQFQSAMVGDNFSRSSEIQGFREGINQYATALANQGKGLKESSNSAIQMLIGETLGITKVNGRPMVVLRDQGQNIPKMNDTEVKDLGRRLGLALQFVDPREVDQKPFTALQSFGNDEQHLPRLQALRDSITSRAFFQTGPDGKSASLYYADDNGSTFQVRDRKNQPFNINFRDLPAFKPQTISMLGMKIVPGAQSQGGEPLKHYDLQESSDMRMFWEKPRTNFPMHMNFLHGMSQFE